MEIAAIVCDRPEIACVRDLSSAVMIRSYVGVNSQLQLLDSKLSRRLGNPSHPQRIARTDTISWYTIIHCGNLDHEHLPKVRSGFH
jgi:hypothetical protein